MALVCAMVCCWVLSRVSLWLVGLNVARFLVMSVGRILWHDVMLCGFYVMTWFHFFSVGFCFV